jgi:F-type H+-transporting ATPase subunit b
VVAGLQHALAQVVVLAASQGGGSSGGSGGGQGGGGGGSGSFLVSPSVGLMIWTLLAFGATYLILRRFAFPRIQEALDRRQKAIEESIDAAERTRSEADDLLSEYRQRLREARSQAEEIVTRARKAAENTEREGAEAAKVKRDEILEQARRDAEAEINRVAQELRKEMAGMVVMATEKVTRKSLSDEDQRRLVEESLSDLDFTALSGKGNGQGQVPGAER